MEFLINLWLPIVLSGVALFFASFVAWTVLPHHQSDFSKAPNENDLLSAIRGMDLPAGNYLFPYMTHQDSKDPAALERYKLGPRGTLALWDPPNVGRNLGFTLLYFLATAAVTAYVAWEALGALPTDGRFLKAFQVTGAIGVLTYASSGFLNAVWFPRRKLNDFIDGIVYGVILGLIFAICWPTAG